MPIRLKIVLACTVALPVIAAAAANAQDLTRVNKAIETYTPVTAERLASPEAKNWLLPKGNYEGWMYSALEQITDENVSKLQPVWVYSTGLDSGHQAPPIVNDGVMFVSTPYNHVLALDAKNGTLHWRYEHDNPPDLGVLHNTSRGVALWGDRVFAAGLDGTLNALDAKTGKRLCQATIGDWSVGAYITSAPLAVEGKILVGPSGGEYGVRGFLEATDAETCERAWKTYSVPGPEEAGHETWKAEGPRADAWKYGGGSMWMPGNYDSKARRIYWGVGNGSPWLGDQRPGDNLYLASSIAMDPDTGKVTGHFQYHHNDSWDWAAMNAPMLLDLQKDGQTVKGLMSPQRNGYMYWLERSDEGAISFLEGKPFVHNNAFKSIDPKTGRPEYDYNHVPVTGKTVDYCPSLWGGKNWPYEAYNPKTGMMYVPANDNICNSWTGLLQEDVEPASGEWWAGMDLTELKVYLKDPAKGVGRMQAWDVNGREMKWEHEYGKTMAWGPVLTTAGNIVFNAGTNDRKLRAFDATSGKVLWEFPLNSVALAPPVTYEVDGKQYLAVVAGYGVDAQWTNGVLAAADPSGEWQADVPVGGAIWVFALPDA